jgi:uracil-DNA glycosylase
MKLNKEWTSFLDTKINSNEFLVLSKHIEDLYNKKIIFPQYENIFRAFNLLTPDKVKVVIIGQDPYHGLNQANGLAFSVCDACKIPPSLHNIFKELVEDIGCKYPKNGNLSRWSEQGVLLINAILTVEKSKANSHKDIGWENFTDSVIEKLSSTYSNCIFVLWGGQAHKKSFLIDETKHLIVKSPHPSPLSAYRGFFGSRPFSKINEYLDLHNIKKIDWSLD